MDPKIYEQLGHQIVAIVGGVGVFMVIMFLTAMLIKAIGWSRTRETHGRKYKDLSN